MKLVNIMQFKYVYEAYIQAGKLDNANIKYVIKDDDFVTLNWFYSDAVQGVKIQVFEKDVERALSILNENKDYIKHDLDFKDEHKIYCPVCESGSVYNEKFSKRLNYLFILVLGFPLLFFRKFLKCYNCGFEWRKNNKNYQKAVEKYKAKLLKRSNEEQEIDDSDEIENELIEEEPEQQTYHEPRNINIGLLFLVSGFIFILLMILSNC